MVCTVVSDAMISCWTVTKYFEVHLVKVHTFSMKDLSASQGKFL